MVLKELFEKRLEIGILLPLVRIDGVIGAKDPLAADSQAPALSNRATYKP